MTEEFHPTLPLVGQAIPATSRGAVAASPRKEIAPERAKLVSVLSEVAQRRALITYVELAHRFADGQFVPNDPALGALLGEISAAEDEMGRGLLSALVVRQDTGLPGAGFFRMAAARGRDVSDRQACWKRERDRVYAAWATRRDG